MTTETTKIIVYNIGYKGNLVMECPNAECNNTIMNILDLSFFDNRASNILQCAQCHKIFKVM